MTSKQNNNNINIINDNRKLQRNRYKIYNIIWSSSKWKTLPKDKKKKIKGKNNINIAVLGCNDVGKSSFCIRFVENKYEDFYIPSIGWKMIRK